MRINLQYIYVLLLARFLQAAVVATLGTAGYASLHESYERIRAIQLLALMGSIVIVAPAFGPLLGGLILQWFSWRWLFILLTVWASIALVGLAFFMPETHRAEKKTSTYSSFTITKILNHLKQ